MKRIGCLIIFLVTLSSYSQHFLNEIRFRPNWSIPLKDFQEDRVGKMGFGTEFLRTKKNKSNHFKFTYGIGIDMTRVYDEYYIEVKYFIRRRSTFNRISLYLPFQFRFITDGEIKFYYDIQIFPDISYFIINGYEDWGINSSHTGQSTDSKFDDYIFNVGFQSGPGIMIPFREGNISINLSFRKTLLPIYSNYDYSDIIAATVGLGLGYSF